jgi:transcriptional regulator with XRE-family HTH domain
MADSTAKKATRGTGHKRKPAPPELLNMPKRIKDELEKQGINKAELARRAEVGRDIVTQAMNGKRLPGIQAANVLRIAKGLKVNAGWLLTGDGDKRDGDERVPVITPGSPEFVQLATQVSAFLKQDGKRR